MASQHSDNVARGDAASTTTTAESSHAAGRSIDNAARATAAEHERTFAAGGDGGPGVPAQPAPAQPAPVPSLVAAATTRVRAPDRPSPFGVGQFPPLPLPPGLAKVAPEGES